MQEVKEEDKLNFSVCVTYDAKAWDNENNMMKDI